MLAGSEQPAAEQSTAVQPTDAAVAETCRERAVDRHSHAGGSRRGNRVNRRRERASPRRHRTCRRTGDDEHRDGTVDGGTICRICGSWRIVHVSRRVRLQILGNQTRSSGRNSPESAISSRQILAVHSASSLRDAAAPPYLTTAIYEQRCSSPAWHSRVRLATAAGRGDRGRGDAAPRRRRRARCCPAPRAPWPAEPSRRQLDLHARAGTRTIPRPARAWPSTR